jgi:hypothetical protein
MGRFDSLKGNSTNENESGSSRQHNRRNNNDSTRSYNRPTTHISQKNSINMNKNKEEEFPELVKTDKKDTENILTESSWQNAMKQRQEEEERIKEGTINQNDPKYWRGATWIGPMLIRQKKYPESWYKYMEAASSGYASSYMFPFRETEYSRDGATWYPSWNETFSDSQLLGIEYEEEEEHKMEQDRILEEYGDKLRNESDNYYEETGEMDGYEIAYMERIAYEKYAEQFDIDAEAEHLEDVMDSDDYLEDDN